MNEPEQAPPRSSRRRQLRMVRKAIKKVEKQRRRGPGKIATPPRRR